MKITKENAIKILEYIYEKGDRVALLQELDPIEKSGHVSLVCPQCGKRRAYTYQPGKNGKTPHIIRCNRSDNCGYQATLIQYAAGMSNPRGDDFKRALMSLATKIGISFEGETIRAEKEVKPVQANNQGNGEFVPLDPYFQKKYDKLSLQPIGMDYLKSRGISEETALAYGIKYAGWGQWPHYVIDKETGKKKPYRQWYPGRLVMPVFDTEKRLISLYGRAVPGDREPYSHLKHDFIGVTKGIFNQEALEQESVHITEGYFDALSIIEASKISQKPKHACAIFGVYGLAWNKVKAKNICFCFDNDSAGTKWKSLAEEGLRLGKRIFFLSSETYAGYNDISEVWEKTRKIDFHYIEIKKGEREMS